jgi:predicted DCC family thiol-disulfide oxidoreductase YuxK
MNVAADVKAKALLIFDGDCAFCTSSVRFIERRIRRHPRIQPWQRSNLPELGLTQEQCETAVQFIEDGRVTSAHVAVARILIYGKKGWAILGYLMLLPGIKQIAGVAYRWVAKNRDRMPGGTAECALPQSERTEREIGN